MIPDMVPNCSKFQASSVKHIRAGYILLQLSENWWHKYITYTEFESENFFATNPFLQSKILKNFSFLLLLSKSYLKQEFFLTTTTKPRWAGQKVNSQKYFQHLRAKQMHEDIFFDFVMQFLSQK